MDVHLQRRERGIAVLTVDRPPVNALPAQGWHDLANTIREVGAEPDTRAVVLQAAGRGFNAGVDIKEISADTGHTKLVEVNRGCYAAFQSVYECPVPVIALVHGHCLGGGVGLVGNADVIIASENATFGLPEVDRGALGAATHLSRLVPQHMVRTLFYTGRTVTAAQLEHFGSVWQVVPQDELASTGHALAEEIAAKNPTVVRRAKEALNGIDPVDVHRNYRYEQGFTFELTLSDVADDIRSSFGRDEPNTDDEGSEPCGT